MSDDRDDTAPRRLIYETRELVQSVRNTFWEEQSNGGVTDETIIDLGTAAMQYRDVLEEFGDEYALDPKWDERNVDWVLNYAGKVVETTQTLPRHGSPTVSAEKPALLTVDPWEIVRLTKRLDEIAKELGFAAKPREKTAHDEVSHEDLRGLLETRGQSEAAQKVPGGD